MVRLKPDATFVGHPLQVMTEPLWIPSAERIARARLTDFMRAVRDAFGLDLSSYDDLYTFSIERPEDFWRTVWTFTGIRGEMGARVVDDLGRMPGARFFPDARLNFAENLLRRPRNGVRPSSSTAKGSGGAPSATRNCMPDVARCAAALRRAGIRPGDRVAAYLPNMPEAIVAVLAAAAIGAVWSSCSPDFGVQGVLDRFGQIEPRLLIAGDGYFYGGKTHDVLPRVAEHRRGVPSIERVVIVPYAEPSPAIDTVRGAVAWAEFLGAGDVPPLEFEPLPFNHPLYILYSSGNDRRPEVHRPRRRRHADPAPQGAPASLRHPARRSRLLLHDLRLDDVELARDGARVRGDAPALRRLAVSSRRQRAVRLRRRDRHDAVRHVGEVHRRGRQGRAVAASTRTDSTACGR